MLAWTLTNGALVAGILGSGGGSAISATGGSNKVSVYMMVLLYSVAVLAFFKAVGSTLCKSRWVLPGVDYADSTSGFRRLVDMIFWLFQG